jgi:hypothetical protein
MSDPSGLLVLGGGKNKLEDKANGGGNGGRGGGWGQDGQNGGHPLQNYSSRYINSSYGPEPRTFGFGGTGGLCIDTNGALIDFYPKDNMPCSGQDNKTALDNKNSEFYRNHVGKGAYLTPKYKSATTISSSGHLSVGYISGLKGHGEYGQGQQAAGISPGRPHPFKGTINFDGVDKKVANQSNALNAAYPSWKAFNQEVNGNFDNYILMDQGGFPYYLVYDFGEGNSKIVDSYSITSAGASAEYYSEASVSQGGTTVTQLEKVMGEVFAPVEWVLFGSNANSDQLKGNETTDVSNMTPLSWFFDISVSKKINAYIPPAGSRNLTDNSPEDPTLSQEEIEASQRALQTVVGDKWNYYVSLPGNTRLIPIAAEHQAAYRYYILKIISADGNQGKVKIADFGLRGKNESYGGFIKLNEGLPE